MSWSCIPDAKILDFMKSCGMPIPDSIITSTEGMTEFPIPEEMTEEWTEFLTRYQLLQHHDELEHICLDCAIREPFDVDKQNQRSSICKWNTSNIHRVPKHVPCDGRKAWVPDRSAWISSWFGVCGGTVEDDDEKIRKHISEVSKRFVIHVGGYCDEDNKPGYGAIVRDYLLKPIIAECNVLPEDECVSHFYHELQGVNLGLGLAIRYGVLNFRIYCTSPDVDYYIRDCLDYNARYHSKEKSKCNSYCNCYIREEYNFVVVCKACLKARLPVDQRHNADLILPLIQDIINKVSELHITWGLPYYQYALTIAATNNIAECLARLGVSKKMKPSEIKENEELTDLLYLEAHDLHTKFYIKPC